MKESEYEVETEVDEVVVKFIKRRKSYNIAFLVGVIISHKEFQLHIQILSQLWYLLLIII